MPLYTRHHQVESQRIYEGHIFNVRKDRLERPDGGITHREVIEHSGGVVIACQPDPNSVVLVKQYRYSIDDDLLELPAGKVERGEERLPAAKRELAEETGYRAKTWLPLAGMYSAPGFCDELLSFYHATDLELKDKNLDHDEETEVLVISLAQAWQWVREGKIKDAKTVAGLGLLIHS